MLSSTRASVRLARRSFATAVDVSGLKVAAIDSNQPTVAVTILANAGPRYRSTVDRGTVRESELYMYSGFLSSTLTCEFLRGDEEFFVNVLASVIASTKVNALHRDPATHAPEPAHALAFRNGLGASLFAAPHTPVTATDVAQFAQSAFAPGNFAVLATGISQSALAALVQHAVVSKSTAPVRPPPRTSATIFIGFGTAGVPAPELTAFPAYLEPNPSIKWAKSASPTLTAEGTSVQVVFVYLPYSDAALVGLLVQGPPLRAIKPEELKAAVAKAKFRLAASAGGRASVIQYSSPGSSSSSAPSSNPSDANGNPTPPSFFEPTGTSDALVPDHVCLRMEFTRMRLRGHLHGGRAVHNAFNNPAVHQWLNAQRLHDHASMQLLSTQMPPVGTSDPLALVPFAAPAPAPSFIVQKWHGLNKETEARREDQALHEKIYEQIRNVNPAATVRWRAYEHGGLSHWAPPLRFQDVP
ncbi:hypothetical protein K438DRAFT_1991000 [Mycena galopus ATCC 62051]|nr:hypothetical protein K438DRAFT_1991000 [Mycena galopus ATCC 62051]